MIKRRRRSNKVSYFFYLKFNKGVDRNGQSFKIEQQMSIMRRRSRGSARRNFKAAPHYNNTEFIITRTGIKQYIHSSCWYDMIKDKRPYDGKMYV